MIILAQAVAEYGGLSGGSSGSTNALVSRITNAGVEEYVIVGVVVLLAIMLLSKLLNAM